MHKSLVTGIFTNKFVQRERLHPTPISCIFLSTRFSFTPLYPWVFLFVWIYFIFFETGFHIVSPNSWQSPVSAHQVLSHIWAIVPGCTPEIWPSSSLWVEVPSPPPALQSMLPRSGHPWPSSYSLFNANFSQTSSSEPPSLNLAFLDPRLWTSSLAHFQLPAVYIAQRGSSHSGAGAPCSNCIHVGTLIDIGLIGSQWQNPGGSRLSLSTVLPIRCLIASPW